MTSGGTGRFSFFVFEYHRRARKGPTRTRRTGCDSRQSTSYCVGTMRTPFTAIMRTRTLICDSTRVYTPPTVRLVLPSLGARSA